MPTLSANGFTTLFDSHVMDICENLRRVAEEEAQAISSPLQNELHEQIVEKFNDFVSSLRDPACSNERAERFQQLVSFLSLHFTFENKLMKMVGYPAYEQHKKQHASFIERINIVVRDIQAGDASVEELVFFIGHWLLGHVLFADKEFGDFQADLPPTAIH